MLFNRNIQESSRDKEVLGYSDIACLKADYKRAVVASKCSQTLRARARKTAENEYNIKICQGCHQHFINTLKNKKPSKKVYQNKSRNIKGHQSLLFSLNNLLQTIKHRLTLKKPIYLDSTLFLSLIHI